MYCFTLLSKTDVRYLIYFEMAGKRNDSGSKLQTAKKKEVGKSTKLSDIPGGRSVSEDKGGIRRT